MNFYEAYQWLHGDRTEYSGCRSAAEAMRREVDILRKDAERWRHARRLFTVDDIESAQREHDSFGGMVSEDGCIQADAAIDAAMYGANAQTEALPTGAKRVKGADAERILRVAQQANVDVLFIVLDGDRIADISANAVLTGAPSAAIDFLRAHSAWLTENWSMSPEGREYKCKFDAAIQCLELALYQRGS